MELRHTSGGQFTQLSYRIGGKGPVIVLIHGFPQSSILWQQVWEELSENFTLIAPDLPGVGGSHPIGENLTIEQLAQSVKCILDKESIETCIIAGHSMGGYTALAFAYLYPESVKGISMVHSLATADTEEKKENRRKAISLIRKGGKEAFISQMMPGLFSKSYKNDNPEVISEQVKQGSELGSECLIAFYNAMINRPDRVKLLAGAGFPVQWIIGKEDTIASAEKVLQQTSLSTVNFVSVYNDCAHMGMLEQPVELIKDLTYFGKYCYKKQLINEFAR